MTGAGHGWGRALRRTIGLLALLSGLVLLSILPILIFTARVFGAAGDGFQRFLVGSVLAIVGCILVGIVGLASWSPRTILRSPLTWLIAGGLGAVAVWAAIGIDSTRPIFALPEARLVYPGAVEVGRGASPAEGGGDRVPSASVRWTFATGDPMEDVIEWYDARLAAAGWVGPSDDSNGGHRLLSWRRGGFSFQIESASASPPGRFTARIWGPPQ